MFQFFCKDSVKQSQHLQYFYHFDEYFDRHLWFIELTANFLVFSVKTLFFSLFRLRYSYFLHHYHPNFWHHFFFNDRLFDMLPDSLYRLFLVSSFFLFIELSFEPITTIFQFFIDTSDRKPNSSYLSTKNCTFKYLWNERQ